MKDLTSLHSAIEAAGIPIHGVFEGRVDYRDEATPEQKAQGDAILSGWDWNASPVPSTVTGTQAKLALLSQELYEAIETWVMAAEAYPNGIRYRIVWDAANWYRTSQELNEIAGDLGLSPEQVDNLFRLAATL